MHAILECLLVQYDQSPSTHLDAEFALATGEQSVQRTSHSFSQVAVDQAIEQTVNRDSKTSGGIIGISTNPSATQRWIFTAHDRAAFTSCCRDLAGIVLDKYATHKEEAETRTARDERDVRNLLSTGSIRLGVKTTRAVDKHFIGRAGTA